MSCARPVARNERKVERKAIIRPCVAFGCTLSDASAYRTRLYRYVNLQRHGSSFRLLVLVLVDPAGQIELCQRARGQLPQVGLRVLSAGLIGDDADRHLAKDASTRHCE